MDKVKMIKKDALINITIGAGMLQKLQKIMFGIAAEISPEQLEEYKKEMENFKQGDEFSEPWMESLTTLSILITECEKEAEKQGFTFEDDINNITMES